jgi:hypothetical protein
MRETSRPYRHLLLFRLLGFAGALVVFTLAPPNESVAGGLFSKFGKKEKKVAKTAPAPTPTTKSRPFQSALAPKRRPSPAPAIRALPVAAGEVPDSPPPLDSLPPVARSRPDQIRIFVLGDSQGLLPFGEELQRELVGRDYEVLFHAVKNGTPYFWNGRWPSPVLTRIYEPAAAVEQCGRWSEVSMPPLSVAAYVAAYDPDIFVFQAGTNFEEDLASESTQGIVGLIKTSLLEATSRGARVLWIGPPDARDDVKPVEFQDRATATLRGALAAVSQEQGFDCFFNSRPVCPIPNDSNGDGEHPSNETGRLWGGAAALWAAESIERWRCDEMLRPPGGPPATPVSRLFSGRLDEAGGTTLSSLEVELELIAKSDPGDIRTLSYTDAFSVYQYRLRKARALEPPLSQMGVTIDPATDEATIYILHWVVHNNGSGPRATAVAGRGIGQVVSMRITPLNGHPLAGPLATMPQFNDFNDFLAPVFLAANFPEERSF